MSLQLIKQKHSSKHFCGEIEILSYGEEGSGEPLLAVKPVFLPHCGQQPSGLPRAGTKGAHSHDLSFLVIICYLFYFPYPFAPRPCDLTHSGQPPVFQVFPCPSCLSPVSQDCLWPWVRGPRCYRLDQTRVSFLSFRGRQFTAAGDYFNSGPIVTLRELGLLGHMECYVLSVVDICIRGMILIMGFVNWRVFEQAECSSPLMLEAWKRTLKQVLWGC